MKKWLKNILALGIGILVSLLLAELVLRIYNPFQTRIRGNSIVLPANVAYVYDNTKVPGLEKHIEHHKNSLGFRGPEPNDRATQKIICVGGSTTECFYLSDGKDWPSKLQLDLAGSYPGLWINNAGLDGHSTLGHKLLLQDHVLAMKPDVILFLVGCNDIAVNGLNRYEQFFIAKKRPLLQYSEIYNLYRNFRMARAASKVQMGHYGIPFLTHPAADTAGWENAFLKPNHPGQAYNAMLQYRSRVEELGRMCEEKGIQPVFITQPSLLSNQTDSVTGRYLGNFEFQGKSGLHYYAVLSSYNQTLQSVCRQHQWVCIDAANTLKSSTENYYDFFHYTNAGAAAMATIIANGLILNHVLK